MMKKLLPFALAVALASCSSAQGAPRPAEVALGVDACEVCHMTVDDPGLAAQFVEAGGRVHRFDAPSCLVSWIRAHPDVRGAAFVSDYGGGGWIPAAEARFVRRSESRAGMGMGVVAFRDPATAEARAAGMGGRPAEWGALLEEGVDDAHAH